MLQQPQDETNWNKVEQLRVALLNVKHGEEDMMLTEEEAGELAAAIRENHKGKHSDEVGEGSNKLPTGNRVCVGVPVPSKNKNVAKCRAKIADLVAHQSVIKVLLRPFESKQQAPLLDAFAKALAANSTGMGLEH